MAKNDFDIDFDFEKEYGFDPTGILDSEYTDDDLDMSEYDDVALNLDQHADIDFDDFDMDVPAKRSAPAYEDEDMFDLEPEDGLEMGANGLDFDDEEELYPDDADLTADMDFSRRASFFAEEAPEEEDTVSLHDMPIRQPSSEELAEEQQYEAWAAEKTEKSHDRTRSAAKRLKKEPSKRERKPIKMTMPPIFGKLIRLYIPTKEDINARLESVDGRRRRRPSRQQVFKEFYLPGVIAGLTIVLMLSFVIGSISRAIDRAQEEKLQRQQQAEQESMAAELLESEGERLLAEAELLAMGYNYQEAADLLDTFQGEPSQEMISKRAEYINAQSLLVEHQDPTLIPNLSFHVLVHDMNRAKKDNELGGQYNRNFVTTAEFSKILEQLYLNNYVLVDFDSFVSSNSVDGTNTTLFSVPILLPEGKKPVMITETMVNYYTYMIDSNNDGIADSGGDGFASKLVVDESGNIKAEYVDENSVTQTGNFDLVPILEDFIAQHPDFSYKGARATLAVSGSQGIFGYRIQSETMANRGQDVYNEEVVGATKIVEALKAKGYTLACYTYSDKDYKGISAAQVQEDIQKWKSQIAPVIGELDTIVFAKASDIGDYTGGKFDVLFEAGFRFMVKNADAPYTEVNNAFVRQSRLMVTGENMVAKASMFTDTGLFDPNIVLDLAIRGNVPVG